jgi:hypothetical protein
MARIGIGDGNERGGHRGKGNRACVDEGMTNPMKPSLGKLITDEQGNVIGNEKPVWDDAN